MPALWPAGGGRPPLICAGPGRGGFARVGQVPALSIKGARIGRAMSEVGRKRARERAKRCPRGS